MHVNHGGTIATAEYNYYMAIPFKGVYSLYLERIDVSGWKSVVGEWDILFQSNTGAGTYTTIIAIDGAAHPVATWFADSASINALLSTSVEGLRISLSEISGSASFLGAANVSFRLVG
jgi:hypothetical protein